MEFKEEEIHEPISVILISPTISRNVKPYKLKWRNREYAITKVASHWVQEVKGIPYHIFSIVTNSCSMTIQMNSRTLLWELDRISDYS